MLRTVRRRIAVAVAAIVFAGTVSMVLIETWVRLSWDDRRGTPGFYISDPILGQRLRPGYDGWFAGVPVRINTLGFRDPRDHDESKPAGAFRILVLGDSVTFGHGVVFEATYPFLLERHLSNWRPDIAWQVWNLGVPGYNTGQELAYLREAGGRYDPDLVIVGFYENDLAGNDPAPAPTALTRLRSSVQRTMQQYLYSYEFYRRVALTLRYRLTTGESDRQRLAELDGEGVLLGEGRSTDPSDRPLNELDYFDDEQVKGLVCSDQPSRSGRQDSLAARLQEPSGEIARWRQTVRALQQLNRDGRYRLMFFVNMAPPACPTDDRFTAGGSLDDDAALAKVLGDGTPVVSSTAEFLHYRPSQMPGAGGHSLGNANRVKAEVLFRYLRGEVLPGLLSNSSAH